MGDAASLVESLAKGGAEGAAGLITTALSVGQDIVDRILPDKEKQAEQRAAAFTQMRDIVARRESDLLAASLALNLAQAEINKVEAASTSLYKSGWRPAVGWACALGVAEVFLVWPLWAWGAQLAHWPEPPKLDIGYLFPLLTALLGLAGLRSFDKVKGNA